MHRSIASFPRSIWRRCLTEFRLPILLIGALALSGLLWLAILAVL